MCTTLVPLIGPSGNPAQSAALAKQAFKQNKTVRQLAEETLLNTPDLAGHPITKPTLDTALDPWAMTLPGGEGSAGG
jgi:hypothetical protein